MSGINVDTPKMVIFGLCSLCTLTKTFKDSIKIDINGKPMHLQSARRKGLRDLVLQFLSQPSQSK